MTGDQKGNLNPNGQLTRAEFAQVLKNFSVLKPTYVETVVSIPVAAQDGIPAHEIPATLTLPVSASKDAKVPGVVMLHGTGSNRDEAGMGYALCLDKLVNTSEESPLCFRPLEPRMEVHLDIVWKKYQLFSGAAERFLSKVQETFHGYSE